MLGNQIEITDHAYMRMKQRSGWNKKTANRMIPRVYDLGTRAENIKGYLKAWAMKKVKEDELGDDFILYGNFLYVFRRNMLVTVLTSPSREHVAEYIY